MSIKFRTAGQDHQARERAVKCLSQGHNRMVRVSFKPRSCQSQSWYSPHAADKYYQKIYLSTSQRFANVQSTFHATILCKYTNRRRFNYIWHLRNHEKSSQPCLKNNNF